MECTVFVHSVLYFMYEVYSTFVAFLYRCEVSLVFSITQSMFIHTYLATSHFCSLSETITKPVHTGA